MAQAVIIQKQEMIDFLVNDQGFYPIPLDIPNTTEMVMGKVIAPSLTLRIYTSIVGDSSRGVGQDAIRCVVVYRSIITGNITFLAGEKRVHRVVNWRKNLSNRIETMCERLPDLVHCPHCGEIMQIRKRQSDGHQFWGCSAYRNGCRGTRPYREV